MMKFNLSTSGWSYSEQDEISRLEKLGFTFGPRKYIAGEPTIEINTLDELMEFVKEYGQIVLDIDTIEIYDDYRE